MKSNVLKIISSTALASMMAAPAAALDIHGAGPEASEAQVIYNFSEGTGATVNDHSTNGSPLPLTILNPSNVTWISGGGLRFNAPTLARSAGPATKIINACNASDELTIEAWISDNASQEPATSIGAMRVVSLSSGVQMNATSGKGLTEGFYFGSDYNAGFQWGLYTGVSDNYKIDLTKGTMLTKPKQNAGQVLTTTALPSKIANANGSPKHVWLIKSAAGNASIYYTDANGTPQPMTPNTATLNSIKGLSASYRLGIGNDNNIDGALGATGPTLQSLNFADQTLKTETAEDKAFSGTIYMVAVYCKAVTISQMLGALAPGDWVGAEAALGPVSAPTAPITPQRQLARLMYQRIGGVSLPIDAQILQDMEAALNTGKGMNDETARMAAADIATHKAGFLNRTVKNFAKQMSNRAEVLTVPLNDFTSTFIGVTRDDIDARQVLTGNFWYKADTSKAAVNSDMISILSSNDHYANLEMLNYDLSSVLTQVSPQYYLKPASATDTTFAGASTVDATNWDYAGVLTSRNWMSEHASAGTNRRLIEFTFQEFLCRQMNQWQDSNAPDQFVGMDVDRIPTGNHTQYQTVCRSCHGQMDGLRPAFSRITFENNFTKHYGIIGADTTTVTNAKMNLFAGVDPNQANNELSLNVMNLGIADPTGTTFTYGTVSGKYNKNNTVFNTGYQVVDSSWTNFAMNGTNGVYFGWGAFPIGAPAVTTINTTNAQPLTGNGVNSFATMIASSRAFPYCMAQKVFASVCKRAMTTTGAAAASDMAVVNRVMNDFTDPTKDNFKFRLLFERMSVQPECLGQ